MKFNSSLSNSSNYLYLYGNEGFKCGSSVDRSFLSYLCGIKVNGRYYGYTQQFLSYLCGIKVTFYQRLQALGFLSYLCGIKV